MLLLVNNVVTASAITSVSVTATINSIIDIPAARGVRPRARPGDTEGSVTVMPSRSSKELGDAHGGRDDASLGFARVDPGSGSAVHRARRRLRIDATLPRHRHHVDVGIVYVRLSDASAPIG